MDANVIKTEMLVAAKAAADKFYADSMGGNDWGACGFAWVTIYPSFAHKGNTRDGKTERKEFEAVMTQMGARLDYTGKAYQLWNPSGHHCQNIDTKEVGARAAATVLRQHGYDAYAASRMD